MLKNTLSDSIICKFLKLKLSTKYSKTFIANSVFSLKNSPMHFLLKEGVLCMKKFISFASVSIEVVLIYPIVFKYDNPLFIFWLNFSAAIFISYFFLKLESGFWFNISKIVSSFISFFLLS